ncbi:MAG: Transposase [Candidatus Methanohalarchaeum thermophilum]|uniref:Transposase n=1 Tax=Methanohalarchaeum thermophilum TaxID=1903181 RepID=A0A1Q6DTM7_METT1|nr:MAG: Transposase [Candidatus Methanohalarchaeum thermophilum]
MSRGNSHDSKLFEETVEEIRIKTGARPKTRPREMLADSAYDTKEIRDYLRKRGIREQHSQEQKEHGG